MKPVVIVGAGLAGLTCARALKRRRVPFLLLEAGERIGGRLKTDVVHGYPLDRGYQVYFTAYPTAKEQLDEDKLDFRAFGSGATIIWDGEQHLVSRDNPLQFALSSLVPLSDKLRLGKWTSDVQWLDQEDIAEIPDRSTEQYLRDEGFSDEFIDRFARPFFGSIFLDRSLATSCRQLLFVWKAMNEGATAIPARGMEEIPKQIGATFGHEMLRLNSSVAELVRHGGAVTGVKLSSGEEIEASQVVLACDAGNVTKLSGVPIDLSYHHSITLYFEAHEQPIRERWVVLNGNVRGITSHVVSLTAPLMAAIILGERSETDDQLADIVKSEMRIWFPDKDVESWKLLKGYRVANAQMAQASGFQSRLPGNDSGVPGLLFAGEFTTNSSIDGAIRSGLECADMILSQAEAGAA